jgi:hypothetical protein
LDRREWNLQWVGRDVCSRSTSSSTMASICSLLMNRTPLYPILLGVLLHSIKAYLRLTERQRMYPHKQDETAPPLYHHSLCSSHMSVPRSRQARLHFNAASAHGRHRDIRRPIQSCERLSAYLECNNDAFFQDISLRGCCRFQIMQYRPVSRHPTNSAINNLLV